MAANVSDDQSILLEGLLYCAPSSFSQQIVMSGEVRLQIEECKLKDCVSGYNHAALVNVIFTTGVAS